MTLLAHRPPPAFPTIAIVNDESAGVDDAVALSWVKALGLQLANDFGPIWHQGAHLHYVPRGQALPADEWAVVLLGNSDQAGALGYHDLTPQGLPLGKVFAGTDRQYGQQVSVTLSHELLEMIADPWIQLAAEADDGVFYAWEDCDAVEADGLGYAIGGVQVSDFVTPAWFGHGPGPYDFRGHLSRPLELTPGGYISKFDPRSGQGWQQVQAQLAPTGQESPAELSAEIAHGLPKVGSRRERRFRGRGRWLYSQVELDRSV